MFAQNWQVQRGQWLSFLCCYVICEMEKTIYPPSRLKFVLNSIKNVHVPMNPQRAISATKGWEYFAKDYLWTVLPNVFFKPIGLFKTGGRVPKSFCVEKPNKTIYFFRSAFQSTLWKHAGEFFLVLRVKNAPELSWGKVLLIRVLYREEIMRHGWRVTLTYCYRLYGLCAFSNRHVVL